MSFKLKLKGGSLPSSNLELVSFAIFPSVVVHVAMLEYFVANN